MTTIQSGIDEKLREAFSPEHLEVINESKNHSVPKGSETHFKVVVVSQSFEGKSRVDRHRLVNDALKEFLKNGVHALTITPRTPAEWATLEGAVVSASPPCLGGSKADTTR
jgi:stress-induced morphogen